MQPASSNSWASRTRARCWRLVNAAQLYVAGAAVGLCIANAVATGAGAAQRTGEPIGRAKPRVCVDPPPAAATSTASRLASTAAAEPAAATYVTGEVLIKFRNGVDESAQARALGALRGRPLPGDLEWGAHFARYRDPSVIDPVVVAATLARQPEVEWAQPNYLRRIPRLARPLVRNLTAGPVTVASRVPSNPSSAALQWNLSLINARAAWDASSGGNPEVIVAVLDTGVTVEPFNVLRPLWTGREIEMVDLPFERSPDLSAARFVAAYDAAFEPGGPVFDFDGHGTHVASTIAEDANNGISLAGLAYNVRIMPVKVCVGYWELMLRNAMRGIPGFVPLDRGGCADADIATGIHYAVDHGARIINLSMSGVEPSPVLRDAITYAVARGAFVAASVGSSYLRGDAVEFPAGYAPAIDGFMSVGAVDSSSARASYSNTGAHLEVVAPGGGSRDTRAGLDRGAIWQVTLFPPDSDATLSSVPRFNRYVEAGYVGTSTAVPHVSGLAALLFSRGVDRPASLEDAIKAMALDLGRRGRDDEYGHGLLRFRAGR